MLDYLGIASIWIFFISIILFIATFSGPLSPGKCKKQIREAREKYTVSLKAKCVRIDENIVIRSSSTRYSDNPHAEGPRRYTKFIKVNQPTYSADYAGHNRSFFKRDLDYKLRAVVGEYYTIYINPNDDTYRDFVDDFFYQDRERQIKKMLICRYTILLIMVACVITFLTIASIIGW